MFKPFLLAAVLAGSAAQGQERPAAADLRAPGLWVDWKKLNEESRAAEQGSARAMSEAADPRGRRHMRVDASALGKQVGEMVATGDCEGGERVAREAGDFALVRAVRDHCGDGRR